MLVRHRLMPAATALLLAACDGFDGPPPAPAPSASAAPSAAMAEETHRLAKAAADAALAAAKTCIIFAPSFDDAADGCQPDKSVVTALETTTAALGAHVKANAATVPRDAAGFTEVVTSFSAWVSNGFKYSRSRGTLRLFQDVADAWNAYQPKEAMPVDPIEEYRLSGFGSKGYIMKPMKKTDGRVVWKSCYDGPCLWENHW